MITAIESPPDLHTPDNGATGLRQRRNTVDSGIEGKDRDYYALYQPMHDESVGCDYCATTVGVDGVDGVVDEADLSTADENGSHPNIRSLVDQDYETLTF